MTTVMRSHQIVVNAPLETVFAYVSDLARHPEWSGGELKIEPVMSGPIAVGKEYRSRGEVAFLKNRPNTVQVTEHEPPHKFGFVANDPDFGKVTHVFTFMEQKEGVLVDRTMTVNLSPIVAFGFRLVVYPLIGSPSMEKSMASLKAKLEASSD